MLLRSVSLKAAIAVLALPMLAAACVFFFKQKTAYEMLP